MSGLASILPDYLVELQLKQEKTLGRHFPPNPLQPFHKGLKLKLETCLFILSFLTGDVILFPV